MKIFKIWSKFHRRDLGIAVIGTDEDQSQDLSLDDIVIIRAPTGHVAILLTRKEGIDMSGIWCMVRLLEASPQDKARANFAEYLEADRHSCAPQWFAHFNGELFNGLDGSDVPPTKLTNDAILDAIRIALSGRTEEVFKRLTGPSKKISVKFSPTLTDQPRTVPLRTDMPRWCREKVPLVWKRVTVKPKEEVRFRA